MLASCFSKMPPGCPGRTSSTLHPCLDPSLNKFFIKAMDSDHGLYQMSTGEQTKSSNLYHSAQRRAVNNTNFNYLTQK